MAGATHLHPIPLNDLVATNGFTVDPAHTHDALVVPRGRVFVLTDVIVFPSVLGDEPGFRVRYRIQENNRTRFQFTTSGNSSNWSQHFTGGIKFTKGTVKVVNTKFSSGRTGFQLLGYYTTP